MLPITLLLLRFCKADMCQEEEYALPFLPESDWHLYKIQSFNLRYVESLSCSLLSPLSALQNPYKNSTQVSLFLMQSIYRNIFFLLKPSGAGDETRRDANAGNSTEIEVPAETGGGDSNRSDAGVGNGVESTQHAATHQRSFQCPEVECRALVLIPDGGVKVLTVRQYRHFLN